MERKNLMEVQTIQCKKCWDIIWSRAQYDFHWCSCGAIAIDGGFEYMRVVGDLGGFEDRKIEVDCTKEEAYQDWNYRKNKLGTIKTKRELIDQWNQEKK